MPSSHSWPGATVCRQSDDRFSLLKKTLLDSTNLQRATWVWPWHVMGPFTQTQSVFSSVWKPAVDWILFMDSANPKAALSSTWCFADVVKVSFTLQGRQLRQAQEAGVWGGNLQMTWTRLFIQNIDEGHWWWMPDEVANIDKHVPLKTLSHQILAIEMPPFDFLVTDFELACSCLIFLGPSLIDLEQGWTGGNNTLRITGSIFSALCGSDLSKLLGRWWLPCMFLTIRGHQEWMGANKSHIINILPSALKCLGHLGEEPSILFGDGKSEELREERKEKMASKGSGIWSKPRPLLGKGLQWPLRRPERTSRGRVLARPVQSRSHSFYGLKWRNTAKPRNRPWTSLGQKPGALWAHW